MQGERGRSRLRYLLLSGGCLIDSRLANQGIHSCNELTRRFSDLSEGARKRGARKLGTPFALQSPSLGALRPAGTLQRDGSDTPATYCTSHIIIVCYILHIRCNNNPALFISVAWLRFPSRQANGSPVPEPGQHLRTRWLAHLSAPRCPCRRLHRRRKRKPD